MISENRWERRQTPVGDEQQSYERRSDEDKIAGYGHRLSLPQIGKAFPHVRAIFEITVA
jgi:hypothetical protein